MYEKVANASYLVIMSYISCPMPVAAILVIIQGCKEEEAHRLLGLISTCVKLRRLTGNTKIPHE